ncbi:response regulator transcription factor [Pseudokineococcus marinus]|uniref:Response regulator transcription factor n=1 Tax=Pseudokineococcus marinus TaxID=351215 RepID=A0A849BKV7_9ACTN|nr:response regulator transcription factor [Pseudokineococcus marinus]NNH23830.1 response regulator transcription factor [Pseudokineococcus marinus]
MEGAATGTRVVVVDDHAVVRAGLRALLESAGDLHVVAEAGTVADAVREITVSRPDVVLVDARLPDGSGVEVCRTVRSTSPGTRCLVLTSYDDDRALLAAVLAGAAGYLLKEIGTADLLGAVRHVHRGGDLVDAERVAEVRRRLEDPLAADERLADLTRQQRRVLQLLAEGRTNRQIATSMGLAEKTVKNYVSHLLVRLGVSSRTQAALLLAGTR